jgi:hypothetical protein
MEFVEGQPASHEVIAEVRRRRIAFDVPDPQHISWQGLVLPVPVREGSVVTHRHRASGAR